MHNRISISDFTQQCIDKQYCLGDVDCFALILDYLELSGVEIPDEFYGWTRNNYAEFYKQDPEHAKQIMINFINSILSQVKPVFAKPGDITLFKLKGSNTVFLAIETANAQIIAVSEERGTSVTPRRYYEALRSWSICPKQFQQ